MLKNVALYVLVIISLPACIWLKADRPVNNGCTRALLTCRYVYEQMFPASKLIPSLMPCDLCGLKQQCKSRAGPFLHCEFQRMILFLTKKKRCVKSRLLHRKDTALQIHPQSAVLSTLQFHFLVFRCFLLIRIIIFYIALHIFWMATLVFIILILFGLLSLLSGFCS